MPHEHQTTDDGPGGAAYDFAEIARRMKGGGSRPETLPERQPFCTAIHDGCDWPDCPCSQP